MSYVVDTWESNIVISSGQVRIVKEMGGGDFGKVLQAEAKKLLPAQKKTTVVVKQLKTGATAEERQTFLRPVEAMK